MLPILIVRQEVLVCGLSLGDFTFSQSLLAKRGGDLIYYAL